MSLRQQIHTNQKQVGNTSKLYKIRDSGCSEWRHHNTTCYLIRYQENSSGLSRYKFIAFLVRNEITLLTMESEDPEDCRETFIEEEIEAEEPRKILHNIVMLSHL